tara:strand:- start:1033 stop:1833 length:801 start_codon:yes stop_codon:yes gene_type:complete
MKELYSFEVKRKVEETVPHIKKTKDGPVETTKKVKKTIKNRIVFRKPSISQVEDADFFYGQKYNEFINAGFLTKAMLAKKMGDLGGLTSKITEERMNDVIVENMEASRSIEFFEGAKDLTEEQEKGLKEAKKSFAESRAELHEYETAIRGQFSQTADSKAEIKVIEWLVLYFSFYEEEVESEDKVKRKDLFPIFGGEDYQLKRKTMLEMQDADAEIEDITFLRKKEIFDEAFDTLIRVASIWYNKMGDDQKSIGQALKDLFDLDEE